MKLLIVESPSKAKTIEKYLEGSYTVRASIGHIRDLPKSNKKAIDIEGGFIPHYEISPGKEKVVAERNMGEHMVTTESTYPVLITVTKEINTPRLPSLMQILSSANKPIKELSADSLGVKLSPAIETVELKGVPMERKNIVYKDDVNESIKKLVDSLAKEGVLR